MTTLRQNLAPPFAFALLLAGLTAPSTAAAQESEAERTAAARALFVQGMEAVDAGDFETAADRLSRSLELRDSPVARTNLALVLIELGRFVEASEHLRWVVRDTEEGSQAHDVAAGRLAEVEARLGQLQIQLGGVTRGVEVLLDGEPVSSALIGVPQPADPGTHRVSIERLDREIAAATVTVEAGRRSDVALVAPAPTPEEVAQMEAPVPGTLPPRDAPAPGVETQWWFWTLVAVLAIGAGVAIGVGVWASQSPEYVVGSSGNVFPTLLEAP